MVIKSHVFRLLILLPSVAPQQTLYFTNLPGYSALDSCAHNGVINAVNTWIGNCPTSIVPTALASCLCLKDQNSAAASHEISTQVLYYCGPTATEDIASASSLWSSYCQPEVAIAASITGPMTYPLITSIDYITNLPAYSALAPCAHNGVINAVNTWVGKCPSPIDPTGLASCLCVKDQNSAAASLEISGQVLYYCGPTATEDMASASSLWVSYCELEVARAGSITTVKTYPPITSVDYITNLPAYSALAPCAHNGVINAVNTYVAKCPSPIAPTPLASCLCVKDQNSAAASHEISTQVLYYCGPTATEDIASVSSLWSSYCSLAVGGFGASQNTVTPAPSIQTVASTTPPSTQTAAGATTSGMKTVIMTASSSIQTVVSTTTSSMQTVVSNTAITSQNSIPNFSTPTDSGQQPNSDFLQEKSNQIALGVGLGIGIPSLILAALGVRWRLRERI